MSFFLTDDNIKLYYEVTGDGSKTVVLIHGFSVSHLHFKKQIPVLSRDYKVVCYDLRGHGVSEIPENGYTMQRYARDLKNLIDYLALKDVVLVGWSMGTHVIFDYIKQFGCEHLGKIVIIDMTAKLITDDDYKHGLRGKYTLQDNLDTLAAISSDWPAFVRAAVPNYFAKSGCKNIEDLEWAYGEAQKNSANVMTRMWLTMSVQDYRDILSKITVPTLITYGEESRSYTPENSEYLRNRIKGSKMVGFPGCGHALQMEDADKFNSVLKEFIG